MNGTVSSATPDRFCANMAKTKRKPTKFSAGTEARRRARELAGPPPAERIIPDKRRKPSKHKKKLLEDDDR
jgi:hypothetical protein